MEMELVHPLPDFNFDSNCSSPYITAPSSPQRFPNLFLTAPPSPSSTSRNSQDFHFLDDHHDFEFDFSGHLDRASLSADELFHGGKIRPLNLKLPPAYDNSSTVSSPRSPRSRTQETRTRSEANNNNNQEQNQDQDQDQERRRGRERTISDSSSSSKSKSPNYIHKGSRSLSPFRVSDLILDQEDDTSTAETTSSNRKPSYASSFFSVISFSSKGYKKWKLKDLLLFRSASEGRAIIGKDQYTVLSKRSSDVIAEDVKNSSFRSTDSSSTVGSSSRRRGRVSAHELHYTANRAVAEEMKRKTFLPYKHGLLGCLGGFDHDISTSIGSLTRG